MTWVIGSLIVLAIVVAVICGALIEVFRQLVQIRTAINLSDDAIPLDVRPGELHAGDLGLPSIAEALPAAIAVFLSPKCATCIAVAEAFRGGAPETVWFVLTADREQVASLSHRLAASEQRIIVDEDGGIAKRVGVDVTPAVFTLHHGVVVHANAVSTARQALGLVPTTLPRSRGRENGRTGTVVAPVSSELRR
jgi:hypothetical protein